MMTDMSADPSRRARRSLVGSLATTALVAPLALAPSAAATPPDPWPDPDNPSLMTALLVLVGIPALLFAAIVLLTYLPSMIHGQRGASVATWHDEPEWFGGPRKGPASAETAGGTEPDATRETGGASARW